MTQQQLLDLRQKIDSLMKKNINKDGVYLILPSNSSLPSQERERLQELGLYRVNV
jgi:hypothetical protein